jgi:hypothetical protein
MPEKGWQRRFDDPIPLPDGGELVTLEDAGTYITKLPKVEHEAPEWRSPYLMHGKAWERTLSYVGEGSGLQSSDDKGHCHISWGRSPRVLAALHESQ